MLAIAFLIGCYSYAILLLGLFHLISFYPVFFVTVLFILLGIVLVRIKVKLVDHKNINMFLIVILVAVNLVGTLGPETAFDALWYHLTIPKLFIQNESVYFIQGNLFYYSLMPKLVEMLYVPALLFSNEVGAKLIHFSFGILLCVALFKLARIYLNKVESIICVLAFYSNLVISWLSITAYSDLGRAFFETLGLLYLLFFLQKKSQKLLIVSALLFGFAICSKVLSIGVLPGLALIVFLHFKTDKKKGIWNSIIFITFSLGVAMPWFLLSFYYTANPVFPLFTQLGIRDFSINLLNPLTVISTTVNAFLFAPDPISPIYLISLPIILLRIKSICKKYSPLIIYVSFSFLAWYFFAQSGGSRFLTVVLPALTILSYLSIKELNSQKISKLFYMGIILIVLSTILYRAYANFKYLPVILGLESRQEFLMKNLNFSFGDFYDENNEIQNIVGRERVLVSGIHNLYFADFNFVLSEWPESTNASYILIRDGVPTVNALKVYDNKKTNVTLYKLP